MCECDGLNNLHEPRLACMDSVTGNVTSEVHHDSNNPAQSLIDLVKDNMQNGNPPSVRLPSGWMVCLDPYCEWECVDSISGSGSYRDHSFKQNIIIYVKSLTNCQNHNTVRCIHTYIATHSYVYAFNNEFCVYLYMYVCMSAVQ